MENEPYVRPYLLSAIQQAYADFEKANTDEERQKASRQLTELYKTMLEQDSIYLEYAKLDQETDKMDREEKMTKFKTIVASVSDFAKNTWFGYLAVKLGLLEQAGGWIRGMGPKLLTMFLRK